MRKVICYIGCLEADGDKGEIVKHIYAIRPHPEHKDERIVEEIHYIDVQEKFGAYYLQHISLAILAHYLKSLIDLPRFKGMDTLGEWQDEVRAYRHMIEDAGGAALLWYVKLAEILKAMDLTKGWIIPSGELDKFLAQVENGSLSRL